ncbi:SRPBCC family protein [Streptomyces cavernae]|uniref:SRPBCC family protein n=1 Tax=Streptomyces cavernae TaxID=2259034 RepID=UPI000FEBA587|nr:SRPBCC family protein [Streptomyces cavernae]
MEHEVFVPVPSDRVREALADPARVARAVPGLHRDPQDTGGEPAPGAPLSGRLKVRVGSHSITYRGTLRFIGQDDGSYAIEGDATESRGTGSVKLALVLGLTPADDGTKLTFTGSVSGDGRVTELPADAVSSAGTRLLSRFAEGLASDGEPGGQTRPDGEQGVPGGRQTGPGGEQGAETESGGRRAEQGGRKTVPGGGQAEPEAEPKPEAEAEPGDAQTEQADAQAEPGGGQAEQADAQTEPGGGQAEQDSSLEPFSEGDFGETERSGETEPAGGTEPAGRREPSGGRPLPGDELSGEGEGEEPPAEAAHARRTMIGRSAEEVDHAPPRGRYAPVPAPETVSPGVTLRWAAPAAALVLASAIVVGRVLRRRR